MPMRLATWRTEYLGSSFRSVSRRERMYWAKVVICVVYTT